MKPAKIAIPLLTPMTGMFPIIIFYIVNCFFSYYTALLAALIAYVLYSVIKIIGLKHELPYTFLVSAIAFTILIILSTIRPFDVLYPENVSIVLELILVLSFFIFTIIQEYFRVKILKKNSVAQEFRLLKFDSDSHVIKIAFAITLFHLLIVLTYLLFPDNYHTPALDLIIYHVILLLFIALHFTYEFIHWHLLKNQIMNEEWLPVVNDAGVVHGKIAMSISNTFEDKYLHPVIRIVLIHKGLLFLAARKFSANESLLLDYPFERHLRFNETLDEGVKEMFIENGVTTDLPYRFIFRYVYKNNKTHRLIYLYACNISDDKLPNDLHLGEGKWWTSKQIEENLKTGLFSTYFEKEYELLNTTVLMADRLMRNVK
ncbi:MAG: hypothetical protein LBG15_00910 [Dysgonamonadaceae bacterium]|jgi:hypothetical protein|nr:hypothetical protein [Dysgonamonadaceae bacterium]